MPPLEPYITVVTPWGTFDTKDRIMDLGNVVTTTNDLGSSSSVSLTLSDTDLILKTAYNSSLMYNQPIVVWQHFEGGIGHILFEGVAGGDIVWDEGQRTLSLDVESLVTSDKVGHIVKTATDEEGIWAPLTWDTEWVLGIELEALNEQAFGKMWPLGFGDVINCPALRLTKPIVGKLQANIDQDAVTITIDGGDKFPQGVDTTIRVGKVFYTGQFVGDVFTPSVSNVTWVLTAPFYESKYADRPDDDKDVKAAWINDMFDYNNAWIQVTGTGITGTALVHVSEQLGRKLIFDFAPPVLLTSAHTITGFTGALKAGQITGDLAVIEEEGYSLKYIADNWQVTKGAHVTDLNVQWYVVNELAGSTIHSVRAYRDLDGVRTLDIVPEAYYTIFPSQALDGKTATLIGMAMPLERVPDEGWEKDIYVSYTSAQGPNSVDVIDYILTTYTSLAPNGSFATTSPDLDDYPVGFALFTQMDALKLAADIAYQSRCALTKTNSAVSIRYLSQMPSGYDTIDAASILERSIRMGFTRLEDIRTHIIGSWNADYSEEGSRTVTYLNNEDAYGVIDHEINLFIYNQAALAKKSLDFWGYRMSNIWRTVQIAVPLIEYVYYPNTEYSFDIPYWGETRGTIQSVSTQDITRTITARLASIMGDGPTTNANYYKGDPDNEVETSDPTLAKDLTVGLYEIDYYPVVTKREKQKIHTVSTTNESGREVKQYDIMILNKDSLLIATDEVGGETIPLIDVDNLHRTASEMYIVTAVTADADPLNCVSANKHISRVRWNPTESSPKINEIWGPLVWSTTDVAKQPPDYEAGTISDKGNAFIIVGGIDTVAKTCLVAPNVDKIYTEVLFRQENSKLPKAGISWPAYMNVGVEKRVVGIMATATTGSGTQYRFKVYLDGILATELTALDLSTNIMLDGLGVSLKRRNSAEGPSAGKIDVVSIADADVGVAGVCIRILLVDYGRNNRDIASNYQEVVP